MNDLCRAAEDLNRALRKRDRRIVLAESCTGGLAAATLAAIPGISRWFCGSAVTYREQTKIQWLGVSADSIQSHTAESAEVACQMAHGALRSTSEADFAVVITGHLGPGAPPECDGVVFLGISQRIGETDDTTFIKTMLSGVGRVARQREAAAILLRIAAKAIEGDGHSRQNAIK